MTILGVAKKKFFSTNMMQITENAFDYESQIPENPTKMMIFDEIRFGEVYQIAKKCGGPRF